MKLFTQDQTFAQINFEKGLTWNIGCGLIASVYKFNNSKLVSWISGLELVNSMYLNDQGRKGSRNL